MENKRLYTSAAIMKSIEKGGLRLSKSLGQNFLKDGNIVRKICDTAEITEHDAVLEIGPGIGTLTEELSLRAKKVIAVEIDKHLIPVLEENLKERPNVKIVHADILKTDVDALLEAEAQGMRVLVVANLPYYITTPILTGLLASSARIFSITAMMQKEVAERLSATPGTSAYGSLSVFAQSYAVSEVAFTVPPTVFIPQPAVSSAVVHMVLKEKDASRDEGFFAFVRACFGQRRKTLVNALSHQTEIPKDEIRTVLIAAGLAENVRAEVLTGDELLSLYKSLL